MIAFNYAFHGRTLLTATLTGKMTPYKKNAGAPAPEIYRLPFPTAHSGISVPVHAACGRGTVSQRCQTGARGGHHHRTGTGGRRIRSRVPMLTALRTMCDEHGIVLIADEIQSGFGRTGKLFAMQHSGVEPDLVTVAKSMAGGLPLSGVIGRAAIIDAVEPGGLGGTYGGSPLACVAALEVLEIIEQERLLERAEAIAARIRAVIEPLTRATCSGIPIANLRGLGAMIGFDVVKARDGVEPDGGGARKEVLVPTWARG